MAATSAAGVGDVSVQSVVASAEDQSLKASGAVNSAAEGDAIDGDSVAARLDVMGRALQHVITENHRLAAASDEARRQFEARAEELKGAYALANNSNSAAKGPLVEEIARGLGEALRAAGFAEAAKERPSFSTVSAQTEIIEHQLYRAVSCKDATTHTDGQEYQQKQHNDSLSLAHDAETSALSSSPVALVSIGVMTTAPYMHPDEVEAAVRRSADAEKVAMRAAFDEAEAAREAAVASALSLLQSARRQHEIDLAAMAEGHGAALRTLEGLCEGREAEIARLRGAIEVLEAREVALAEEWRVRLDAAVVAAAEREAALAAAHEAVLSEMTLAHSAALEGERDRFNEVAKKLQSEADASFHSLFLASEEGRRGDDNDDENDWPKNRRRKTAYTSEEAFAKGVYSCVEGFLLPLFAERSALQAEWQEGHAAIALASAELRGLAALSEAAEEQRLEKELIVAHFSRERERMEAQMRVDAEEATAAAVASEAHKRRAVAEAAKLAAEARQREEWERAEAAVAARAADAEREQQRKRQLLADSTARQRSLPPQQQQQQSPTYVATDMVPSTNMLLDLSSDGFAGLVVPQQLQQQQPKESPTQASPRLPTPSNLSPTSPSAAAMARVGGVVVSSVSRAERLQEEFAAEEAERAHRRRADAAEHRAASALSALEEARAAHVAERARIAAQHSRTVSGLEAHVSALLHSQLEEDATRYATTANTMMLPRQGAATTAAAAATTTTIQLSSATTPVGRFADERVAATRGGAGVADEVPPRPQLMDSTARVLPFGAPD